MRGIGLAGLSASQVSSWHTASSAISLPSRPAVPGPFVRAVSSGVGIGAYSISAPSTVDTGDIYFVVAGCTNPLSAPTAPTSSGLTFTSLGTPISGIAMWKASSPDATPRIVATGSGSSAGAAALLVIGGATTTTNVGYGTYGASTTTPTITAAAGTGFYLGVAAIVHASYPTAPTFSAPAGWTLNASVQNTGWNGLAVATCSQATGLLSFGATPAATGVWGNLSIS